MRALKHCFSKKEGQRSDQERNLAPLCSEKKIMWQLTTCRNDLTVCRWLMLRILLKQREISASLNIRVQCIFHIVLHIIMNDCMILSLLHNSLQIELPKLRFQMHSWCADRGRRSVLQNSMAAVATAELAPAAALADGGDVAVLNNGMKFPKAPKHQNGT